MANNKALHIDPASEKAALAILDKIEQHARGRAMTRVMQAAGEVVRREVRNIVPKPGYPGDKPGLKPLRETVAVRIRNYQGGFFKVMLVGYQYPAGAHGHLVEDGHEKVLWGVRTSGQVEGKHYFQMAVKRTEGAVNLAILNGAQREAARDIRPAGGT